MNARMKKLQQQFISSPVSSCPAAKDSRSELEIRLAGVSPAVAQDVVSLLQLISEHRIEPFETPDELRAGVFCPPLARVQVPEKCALAREIFFGPSHLGICGVLGRELKSAGKKYRRIFQAEEARTYWAGGEGEA